MQLGGIAQMQQLQNNAPLTSARPEETIAGSAQEKYIINTLIGAMHTCAMVRVTAVSVPTDSLEPIGRCSIQPLVQKVDGNNNVYSRGEIDNVPYLRVQGGTNAIVIDPVVGDIGIAAFCDRDISMVKRTGEEAAPNTLRQYDLNDAVYLFSCMSGTPSQYIQFLSSGINIKTTGDLNINGLVIKADGTLITKDGDTVDKHNHGNVQNGPSNTAPLGG
jgi:hypothetical protein